MDLYLLRHAQAVERASGRGGRDSERALTTEGRQRMKRISRVLAKLEFSFDLILTSPYRRAQQTARIVAEELHLEKRLRLSRHLFPEADPEALLEELDRRLATQGSVLLVGHEPSLGRILSVATCGGAGLSVTFKKAGLAKVAWGPVGATPRASLEWLLTPRQLLSMGEVDA